MEVSGTGSASAQVEVMKKATQVQEQSIKKVLDSSQEQTQQINSSQKTGMGKSLDLLS